jgi:hypothetical protein
MRSPLSVRADPAERVFPKSPLALRHAWIVAVSAPATEGVDESDAAADGLAIPDSVGQQHVIPSS